MKWFDYAAPKAAAEAAGLLARGGAAHLLAGGTDLIVQLRTGRKLADLVVDIKKIPELNALQVDSGGLTLGAATPCYRIYRDAAVRKSFPALVEVASLIGGTQIQGRASIGGNLCNAAPSADAVPLLIAMSARCRVASSQGTREIAVEDFCVAPGKNCLNPGELLVSIHIPAPKSGTGAHYVRFIPRNEMDIAVAGAGAWVEMSNGTIRSARVALASVAPTPLYVREVGEFLAGRDASDDNLRQAAEITRVLAKPITDMRGPAEYRRHLCTVLTRRALEAAIRHAKGGN